MKQNLTLAVAGIALLLGGWAVFGSWGLASNGAKFGGTATSAGNLLAENYIPYVLYNGGYNSAKDISTTGNFNAAIAGFSGALSASSTVFATGAVTLYSSLTQATADTGTTTAAIGCIQTTATSTATPVKLMMGSVNASASTTFTSTTVRGSVVWAFGTCPSI